MPRIIDAFSQFLDDSGDPLVNGWLRFYESGSTTDKNTYSDSGETIANTNPVQLDGAGRCPNIFGSGTYKIISYKDSVVTPGTPGEQIQQFDPVGGTVTDSQLSDWDATTVYSVGDIRNEGGEYYRSITNNNINNTPSTSPTNWELLRFGRVYNANVTYQQYESCYGSDGALYVSMFDSNIGNDPVSDTQNWRKSGEGVSVDKSLWPTLANDATDSEHDIVFSAGKISDSTGSQVINLTLALTKQIDAAWAAGSNVGGLFSGSVAADSVYGCFVIVKDSDGSVDCGFDTSETAANIPSGYTAYRRVGWVVTDASSNIIGFSQNGDNFRLKSQILEVNDASPGTSANTLTTNAPQSVYGVFGGYLDHTTSVIALIGATSDDDNIPGADDNTLRVIGTDGLQQSELLIPVDSSRQIRYRSSVGTITSLRIFLRGWIDQRA